MNRALKLANESQSSIGLCSVEESQDVLATTPFRMNTEIRFRGSRGALALLLLILATPCSAVDRSFTVWDSISMARFNDPYTRDPEARAKMSPDGRHFAVVTSRGLDSNKIESSIWTFEADQVRTFLRSSSKASAPRPRLLARFSAVPKVLFEDSYTSTITEMRWSRDSGYVYCLVQNQRGEKQLYQVRFADGATLQLSLIGYSVDSFDVSRSEVAYAASRSGDTTIDEYYQGRVLNVGASALTDLPISIGDILFAQNRANYRFFFTWVRRGGREHRILASGPTIDDYRLHPSAISPDGNFLVELLPVQHIPAYWAHYQLPGASEGIQIHDPNMVSPFNMDHLMQYSIIDLTTGKTAPLIDGPSASTLGSPDVSSATWSGNSKRILITSAFLPRKISGASDRNISITPCAAAVVDIRTHDAQCIAPTRFNPKQQQGDSQASAELTDARFGQSDHEVVLFFLEQGQMRVEKYEYREGQWIVASVNTVPNDRSSAWRADESRGKCPSLWIRQDLNSPPTLWATDYKTGNSREIWDPNPQLQGIKRGEVSIFRWKDTSGYEWTGGLIKPVGYMPGQRYPLVIQTHGFQPNEFLSDGSYTTAMAAMPLASAGIMVLQVPDRRDHSGTDQEATDHVVSFKAAIEKLAAEGMIDPARVGLIGFSRTCYYVLSALVRDPSLYAAATVADGVDGSYMEHRLYQANMGTWDVGIYGGAPTGRGLRKWVASAPDFHLDSVLTPLRIEAIGPASLLGEWELYSSLKEQNKPVDLIYIREGQHILQKPLNRAVSQQGNVDWFRFWLTDQMCSASEVPVEDRRWIGLRELERKGHAGNCEGPHVPGDRP